MKVRRITMSNPIYKHGDVIYLRESAMLGFLESYEISGIEFNPGSNQWVYKISVRYKHPASTSIDANQLQPVRQLYFREAELINLCEALDIAITETENRLTKLKDVRNAQCG